MLTDPQSVTINGVATSLPLVSASEMSRTYMSNDGNVKLIVSHQRTKSARWRRLIKLYQKKVASDPFTSGKSNTYDMSAYINYDVPEIGFTVGEQKYVSDALVALLSASSGAIVTRVLGGES